MTEARGMVVLLRDLASRLENGAGLRRDFLEEVASKLEKLDEAANVATAIVRSMPRRSKNADRSLVSMDLLRDLTEKLNNAGGEYVSKG